MNERENTIKEWLLPKLEERGLSVEEFADSIHLSRTSVYYYFTDKSRPSIETMALICNKLDLPLEEGLRQYIPKVNGFPKGNKRGVRPL